MASITGYTKAQADTLLSGKAPSSGIGKAALASAVQASLDRADVAAPRWQPNTAYAAGQAVLLPDGTTGTAKVAFTSGASFSAANWNVAAGGTVVDADASTKGKVALAGDLGGTADAPTVFRSVQSGVRIARTFSGQGAPPASIAGAVTGDVYVDLSTSPPTVYDIVVSGPVAPTITSGTPGVATVGTAYSFTFSASGDATITWAVSSGTLPAGLALSTSGILSGTPTAAGSSSFTVTAINAAGAANQNVTLTVSASAVAPTITSADPAAAVKDAAYSHTFAASGTTPTTWSVSSGSLPTGLSLDSSSGVLSGVPTVAGSTTFTIAATNSAGSASKSVTVAVTASTSVPGAPTGLSLSAGAAQLVASWTAPSSNGGAAITDYVVQYRTSPSGSWTTFAHTATTATSMTVTGLTNGTAYDVQVAAVNSVGTGAYSSSATATPVAAGTVWSAFSSDSFADGAAITTLVGRTTDAANGGTGKAYAANNSLAAWAGNSSGQLTIGADSGSQNNQLVMAAGKQRVGLTMVTRPTTGQLYLYVASSSSSAGTRVRIQITNTGALTCNALNASTGETVDSGISATAVNGDQIELEIDGTTVTVRKNGTTLGSFTAPSNFTSYTYAGFGRGSATGLVIDNVYWQQGA